MLGNLKNPPEPFGDIIRTHFRLKAKSISAQLDDWLAKDDGKQTSGDGAHGAKDSSSNNGFQKDVKDLKELFESLQTDETL